MYGNKETNNFDLNQTPSNVAFEMNWSCLRNSITRIIQSLDHLLIKMYPALYGYLVKARIIWYSALYYPSDKMAWTRIICRVNYGGEYFKIFNFFTNHCQLTKHLKSRSCSNSKQIFHILTLIVWLLHYNVVRPWSHADKMLVQ